MEDLRPLLQAASTIELIDWPHQSVPATLHRAGYRVLGREPSGFKEYVVADAPPADAERTFPLDDGAVLATLGVDALPARIDIVCSYRPPDEQPDYSEAAAKAGAKAYWLQPGEETSEEAHRIATAQGLKFVDGVCIAEAVRTLGVKAAGS